jgi:hypothetical protein
MSLLSLNQCLICLNIMPIHRNNIEEHKTEQNKIINPSAARNKWLLLNDIWTTFNKKERETKSYEQCARKGSPSSQVPPFSEFCFQTTSVYLKLLAPIEILFFLHTLQTKFIPTPSDLKVFTAVSTMNAFCSFC